MKIKTYVEEGELVPWYYGFGYYEYISNRTVVYIIPINIFVQVARYLHRKLRNAIFDCESDLEQMAYRKGKNEGYKNGYEKGVDHGIEQQRKYTEKNLRKLYETLKIK